MSPQSRAIRSSELAMYTSNVRSLLQACKKAKGDLVRDVNRVRSMKERAEREKERADKKRKAAELSAIAADEQADIEPGIFGLSVFQSMKETNAAWEGLVRLDFGGGESALEQFDPSDQPCVCFEIGTPSDKSFVCDSMPANADSPEDEAATWTEKSIGFPEWDELLDATVVPSDAMVMLEQSCWATYQYLKQPELRAKDTDRILSASLMRTTEESLYIGVTDLLFPQLHLCLNGKRCMIAAPVAGLLEVYKRESGKSETTSVSVVDLCNMLTEGDLEIVRQAKGMWCTMEPNVAVVLPPGWIVASGSLENNTVHLQVPCATRQQLASMSPSMFDTCAQLTTAPMLRLVNRSVKHGLALRNQILAAAESLLPEEAVLPEHAPLADASNKPGDKAQDLKAEVKASPSPQTGHWDTFAVNPCQEPLYLSEGERILKQMQDERKKGLLEQLEDVAKPKKRSHDNLAKRSKKVTRKIRGGDAEEEGDEQEITLDTLMKGVADADAADAIREAKAALEAGDAETVPTGDSRAPAPTEGEDSPGPWSFPAVHCRSEHCGSASGLDHGASQQSTAAVNTVEAPPVAAACASSDDKENGALHQHGARAEEVATAKIQAEPAEEMPAVDIGTAAHDKEKGALHLHGSRAEEEMATVKTQAAEPPAVDIGAAAHDKENGALHQHGSSAEEMATAKIQAEPAKMPAVDIGTAAHDKENGALHQHGSSAEGMAAAKTPRRLSRPLLTLALLPMTRIMALFTGMAPNR
ncbi:unnamed protein product [Effrenium voratum]|uniref:Uncharacterized protein n=2 Tax=Effrenium voratum TaxID=2562239 RepID=A0AA36IMY8_9DINO|nr:unnamed protein product [Effrenium voratum]